MASSTIENPLSDLRFFSENGFYVYIHGRVVEFTLTGTLTETGKYFPQSIKPLLTYVFNGKANYNGVDYWDWGFRLDNNGLLTARSRDNNSSVQVTWINIHGVFLM